MGATQIAGNPWIIDSADVNQPGPLGFALGATLTTLQLCTQGVRWVGSAGSNPADVARLKDTTGRVVWESDAAGANNLEESTPQRKPFSSDIWQGLVVDKLDSGKLYIYLM